MSGPRRPPTRTAAPAARADTSGQSGRAGGTTTKTGTRKTGTAKAGTKKTGTAKTGMAKTGTAKTGMAKAGTAKTGTAKGTARRAARDAGSATRSQKRAMGHVDGPRGRRQGAGEEARRRTLRRRARLMVGLAVTVVLAGVLVLNVLPTQSWLGQRDQTDQLESELAEIQAERAEVQAEIDRLGTESEIEALARRNGYVRPGEEAYNILPVPIDPIGLPDTWPFIGVEEAMGVR